MKTETELPLPCVELAAGKMPGHWLLARLGMSSWAAIVELQQPESTRPYDGPPLLRLPSPARRSLT